MHNLDTTSRYSFRPSMIIWLYCIQGALCQGQIRKIPTGLRVCNFIIRALLQKIANSLNSPVLPKMMSLGNTCSRREDELIKSSQESQNFRGSEVVIFYACCLMVAECDFYTVLLLVSWKFWHETNHRNLSSSCIKYIL